MNSNLEAERLQLIDARTQKRLVTLTLPHGKWELLSGRDNYGREYLTLVRTRDLTPQEMAA